MNQAKPGLPKAGLPKADLSGADLSGSGLDGLMPQVPGDGTAGTFAAALLLAALRRDGRGWLGAARVARLAAALGQDEATVLLLLDRAPRPPAALGEAAAWLGRRVPILRPEQHRTGQHGAGQRGAGQHGSRIGWAELFWRPDRAAWRRSAGAFALRLTLPGPGRVELRGRLEEDRLDAVLHTERALPRATAVASAERFDQALRLLGLRGGLSVRSSAGQPT